MGGLMCPHCQGTPDSTEEWLRIKRKTPVDSATSSTQLLLDGETESTGEGLATSEDVEFMTTLQPCGHSFPRDALKAVEEQLQIIEKLMEKHDETTNPLELQMLRRDIHSAGEKLDTAAERCEEQMDATRSENS
jgi:hypothetical protein